MMTNLFSSFDPSSSTSSLMNWVSILAVLLITPKKMSMMKSRWLVMEDQISKKLVKEFKSITPNKQILLKTTSMFLMILTMNIFSIFPYTFTPTSHLAITLSMALPTWIMSIMFMMIKKTNVFFSHLLPLGSPPILMPFLILIETTGILMRPLSLSIRLMANLTAGHLIMILLGTNKEMISIFILPIQAMFMLFELSIAMIQAYVFSTISTLYSKEN